MQEKKKAIFLDRDGTINAEKNYLYKIEDFEFLPGVLDGLRMLQHAGYLLIIITNQSGIARGYYTETDFNKLTAWMIDYLQQEGITISVVYYCPHHPEAAIEQYRQECDCRKPHLALFQQAIKDFNLELCKCYAIGDRLRDCMLCMDSDCKGFLIGCNEDANILNRVKNGDIHNLFYAKDLYESACKIIAEENK